MTTPFVDPSIIHEVIHKDSNYKYTIHHTLPPYRMLYCCHNVNKTEKIMLNAKQSEENIKKRLAKAEYEMTFKNRFDTILISDKLDQTLEAAQKLVSNYVFPQNC